MSWLGKQNSDRFIPAGAGNTPGCRRRLTAPSVHPHGCGGHVQNKATVELYNGSSPQVRGTLDFLRPLPGLHRFIPAKARNTHDCQPPSPSGTVHPRRCGEHPKEEKVDLVQAGSSPQVRGTLKAVHREIVRVRFIPAGAGNTPESPTLSGFRPVHPRRCGEHDAWRYMLPNSGGSSPQVRGT